MENHSNHFAGSGDLAGKVILLDRSLEDRHISRLQELAPDLRLVSMDERVSQDDLEQTAAVIGWNDEIEKRLNEAGNKQLKWIQTFSAGVDRIDQKALDEKNIVLTNASGIHGHPIRETLFGMMLAFARGISYAIKKQNSGSWDQDADTWILQGKTIMIYGTGAIGTSTAQLAKQGFGMRTIGVNRSGRAADYMDECLTTGDAVIRLEEADFVVAILPLTSATHGFFDREFFRRMKPGSVFLNAGRGASVVTDDLLAALQDGRPGYAGLDVTDPEPLPADHPLWQQENVIITPHISGSTPDYVDRAMDIIAANLESFVKTGMPERNVVDYERGY